jgi:signal transduction histidine kinase
MPAARRTATPTIRLTMPAATIAPRLQPAPAGRIDSSEDAPADSALISDATALLRLGEYRQAIELLEQGERALPAGAGPAGWERVRNNCRLAQAWFGHAGALFEDGDRAAAAQALAAARRCAEKACAAATQAPAAPAALLAQALDQVASVLLATGEPAAAQAWLQRVQAALTEPPAPGSFEWALLRLCEARVGLHTGADPRLAVQQLIPLASLDHAAFKRGQHRLALLQTFSAAAERSGDFRAALAWRKRWVDARARAASELARERSRLSQHNFDGVVREAQAFVRAELHAPLTVVLGHLQASAGGAGPERHGQHLQRAERCVHRALSICEQFLAMLDAEHSARSRLRVLDLGLLAEEVCDQAPPPTAWGVRLERTLPHGVWVQGDANLLARAIGNLIGNALQHAPPASAVQMSLQRQDDGAVLTVQDSGPGLPLAIRTRLFQRYATGRADSGNGLGLALVARVARLHGARVEVSAQPGSGTCVALRLKLAAGPS